MALNLKKLRDLITFSREVPGYSTPGAAEGPDEGSGEGSYSSSLEGSDQGSGEGSTTPVRRGPHREATATGRRLLSSIPDMISSGITAAATPNIAGGGWADIFRGAAAGQTAVRKRHDQETKQRGLDALEQQRLSTIDWNRGRLPFEQAKLDEKAKNDQGALAVKRDQTEINRGAANSMDLHRKRQGDNAEAGNVIKAVTGGFDLVPPMAGHPAMLKPRAKEDLSLQQGANLEKTGAQTENTQARTEAIENPPEKPKPENLPGWIAMHNDPTATPDQVNFAAKKIDEWKRTTKNQRPPAQIVIANSADDDAITRMAERSVFYGEPPSTRNPALMMRVEKRAAELAKEYNISTADTQAAKMGQKGDSASFSKLQATLDAINAFEGTAHKNLDQFIGQAKQTIDTGLPWANQVFRGGARMIGDPNAAAFEAARTVAFTEVAKVLNNPTSAAVLSDSARKEAEKILDGSYTLAQLMKVADLLKQDMTNRKTETQRALNDIQKRTKGRGTPQSPTAPPAGGGDLSGLSTDELFKRLSGGK